MIFEFGLYVGRLGREHSIIVAPKGDGPRLPSDLLGINVLKYDGDREDGSLEAAVGPACNAIRKTLSRLQPRVGSFPRELALSFIERRDQLSAKQRALLSALEARDRCSKQELQALFHDTPTSELHYRLEQLRLLAFLDASLGTPLEPSNEEYALSAAYRAFLKKLRQFVPSSAGPFWEG